jgi:hypothetical protein
MMLKILGLVVIMTVRTASIQLKSLGLEALPDANLGYASA